MANLNVWNGNTVQTIVEYIEEHFAKLEKIIETLEDKGEHEHYARRKSMVALDATGAGILQWQVPLGNDWILKRVTVTSTGAGTCQFFVDTTSPSDLVEQIASSQLYSDAFDNDIYIPSGSMLFAVFAGAGANGQGTVNLQLRIIEKLDHSHPAKYTATGNA